LAVLVWFETGSGDWDPAEALPARTVLLADISTSDLLGGARAAVSVPSAAAALPVLFPRAVAALVPGKQGYDLAVSVPAGPLRRGAVSAFLALGSGRRGKRAEAAGRTVRRFSGPPGGGTALFSLRGRLFLVVSAADPLALASEILRPPGPVLARSERYRRWRGRPGGGEFPGRFFFEAEGVEGEGAVSFSPPLRLWARETGGEEGGEEAAPPPFPRFELGPEEAGMAVARQPLELAEWRVWPLSRRDRVLLSARLRDWGAGPVRSGGVRLKSLALAGGIVLPEGRAWLDFPDASSSARFVSGLVSEMVAVGWIPARSGTGPAVVFSPGGPLGFSVLVEGARVWAAAPPSALEPLSGAAAWPGEGPGIWLAVSPPRFRRRVLPALRELWRGLPSAPDPFFLDRAAAAAEALCPRRGLLEAGCGSSRGRFWLRVEAF